jgi:hypothetical protein
MKDFEILPAARKGSFLCVITDASDTAGAGKLKLDNSNPVPALGTPTSCSFINVPALNLPDSAPQQRASRSGASQIAAGASSHALPTMNVPQGFQGMCPVINTTVQKVTFSLDTKEREFAVLLTDDEVRQDVHAAQQRVADAEAQKQEDRRLLQERKDINAQKAQDKVLEKAQAAASKQQGKAAGPSSVPTWTRSESPAVKEPSKRKEKPPVRVSDDNDSLQSAHRARSLGGGASGAPLPGTGSVKRIGRSTLAGVGKSAGVSKTARSASARASRHPPRRS